MTAPSGYCPFVVGDRVVCVDAGTDDGRVWLDGEAPVERRMYTVRQIGVDVKGSVCLGLEELNRHRHSQFFGYWGYRASRFRPAPTISVFTELLIRVPVDEVVS